MKPTRRINRRSFAASVLGGVAIGGGATAFLTERASAQTYTGTTDCDAGGRGDRPGYGTGVRNQYTDSDSGANADPRCHGRGPGNGSPTGTHYAEPPSGCSDSDGGPGADPGNRGRHCGSGNPYPRSYTPENTRHCSDSDSGNNADPIQQGRHC